MNKHCPKTLSGKHFFIRPTIVKKNSYTEFKDKFLGVEYIFHPPVFGKAKFKKCQYCEIIKR